MGKAKAKAEVTVRMYCQGLGDCFLLSFPPAKGTKPVRVLIDCGVFQHTREEAARMRRVAEHLKDETGGHIDVLVVTHEHWDHVAGFSHAQDIFKDFKFDHVWLSWAEDPADTDATKVKERFKKRKKTIATAVDGARARLAA